MTLLVGILCQNGVVIASDSAATYGTGMQATIGQQQVQKVQKVNEHIIYCGTGAVGISQLISNEVRKIWDKKALSGVKTPEDAMSLIGHEIGKLVAPYLNTAQFQRALTGDAATSLCKSMIALPINKQPQLFQFDFNGAPERATSDLSFVALGSGQPIADPFLALLRRLFWADRKPTLSEGRFAAIWTISHVCATSPGGVGGNPQLAILERQGSNQPKVSVATSQDIEEHLEKIASVETALVKEVRGESSAEEICLPANPLN